MKKIGLLIILMFSATIFVNAQGQGSGNGTGSGSGQGVGNGMGSGDSAANQNSKNKSLKILSKPRVAYTEIARNNDVQGTVSLKVEFKKDGKIGKISVVKGLPYGLTQEAIKAAEKIKFEPATKNSKKITVTKTVEYSFILY